MSIKHIIFTRNHEDAIIPTRGTPESAGFDLYALEETVVVGGDGNIIVPTGISVHLLPNTYGRIAMRSGLSVKQHLAVSAGVIDIDYSGNIGVVVFCTKNNHTYTIQQGERFAQLIPESISYAPSCGMMEVHRDNTNHAGWGSTGK